MCKILPIMWDSHRLGIMLVNLCLSLILAVFTEIMVYLYINAPMNIDQDTIISRLRRK